MGAAAGGPSAAGVTPLDVVGNDGLARETRAFGKVCCGRERSENDQQQNKPSRKNGKATQKDGQSEIERERERLESIDPARLDEPTLARFFDSPFFHIPDIL